MTEAQTESHGVHEKDLETKTSVLDGGTIFPVAFTKHLMHSGMPFLSGFVNIHLV